MRSEPTELEFTLSDIRLAALEWGRPEQPLLLALHGWMDNAGSFAPLAEHLGDYRVVAIELAGHGHSDHRPPGVPYDLPGYLADILSVIDLLQAESVTLMGHSLGAALATLLAASFPERVDRLVLLDGLAPLSAEAAEAPRRLRKSLRRTEKSVSESTSRYAKFDTAVQRRARRGGMSQRAAANLVRRGTVKDEEGIRWRSDLRAAELSPFYLTEEQVLAFLGSVVCPTLLIKGTSGLLAARKEKSAIRERAIGDLTSIELPGGHHLHMEIPEAVAETVRRFLQ